MSERLPGIRPRPNFWRRMDILARQSFAVASTAILLLVAAAPIGLPGQAHLLIAAAVCCVFFWSLFRPGAMSPPLTFLLGVLVDLLSYGPPGIGVLTLLLVQSAALHWRRLLVRQGFLIVWLAFVLVAVGTAMVQWLFTSILLFSLLPPHEALFQALLAAGLYPPLAVLLSRAHHSLAAAGEA